MSIIDSYQPIDDGARAITIPAAWYLDPEMLACERARVFSRTWQPVGQSADVANPGDYFTCEVAGEPLVIVRDLSGALAGFYNVCRHRAAPVAIGRGNRARLQCVYHSWTYELDGRLCRTPGAKGFADWDPAKVCLPRVAVATWGPLVFVNLDPDADDFERLAAPMAREVEAAGLTLDGLSLVARRDYDVASNWKVYIDNYIEAYHVPTLHPGLYSALQFDRYRVELFEQHVAQRAPLKSEPAPAARGGDSGADPATAYRATDGQALYYWVFPNWMINLYPGNLQFNIVIPVDHERTITVFEWYTGEMDADERERFERAQAFSHQIQVEDVEVCELVQRGLKSRSYDTGRLVPGQEHSIHGFHRMLHACLTAGGTAGTP